MRRALVALAVFAAGCSGALGGGTPSATVTPAPVPSATATPTSPLPGVTDGRLADPWALASAHRSALSGTSYTRTRVERLVVGNATRWTIASRTRVAPDGRAHTVIVPEGPARPPTVLSGTTRIERYVGESATWVAVRRHGERRVTRYPQGFAISRPQLYPVLASVRVRVAGRERMRAGVRYRLAGAGVRDEGLLRTAAGHREAVEPRLSATVTPRGVVRAYEFTYRVATPPSTAPRRFVHEFRIRKVGETSVSEPGWVPGNATRATAAG